MNKTAIKNFAIWARNKLIADITYKAGLLGVTEQEIKPALPISTKDVHFFDIGTKEPYSISGMEIKQREKLAEIIGSKAKQSDYGTAYKEVVEEVAYTWFNRLIAVRFMEVNDYLPSRIRVLSSESNTKIEPDLVTTPFDADLDFTPYEKDRIVQLTHENKLDELFQMLFIKQCNALNAILPNLFEKTRDYTELLLNVSFTDKDGMVYRLVHDIPEDDFDISKEGQVEIIGWLYQHYNTEPKDEAFALLKKNVKITKERIPAATQLFTPDWIVRYMVENSLGRLWIERERASSGVSDKYLNGSYFRWKYYLEESEQESNVKAQLAKIREEYKTMKPEDIKVIDPCMGSGHILVYAFDVLMHIYESCGYSQRDAAKSILVHNIYGLDIDNRAYQLAYFAIMMKARQYNRRILNGKTDCHVWSIQESNGIYRENLKYFGAGMSEIERNTAILQVQGLLDTFIDAKEYGSILNVENYNWELLYRFVGNTEISGQLTLEAMGFEDTKKKLRALVEIGAVMAQKYDVVVTNPPYMGSSGMSPKVSDFVKRNYPVSKSDLSAVFIQRCIDMAKPNQKISMVTMQSWMFLSSLEMLRMKVIANTQIETINHLGMEAFDGIIGKVVATVAFCLNNASPVMGYKGTAVQLTSFYDSRRWLKESEYFRPENRYCYHQGNLSRIPGMPIAYWVSDNYLRIFEGNKIIGDLASPRRTLQTGDSNRFMRYWYEVSKDKTCLNYYERKTAIEKNYKWYMFSYGGAQRKWYGNLELVVNWEHNGREIKATGKAIIPSESKYFIENLGWSKVTSAKISVRYYSQGIIPGDATACIFDYAYDHLTLAGYMNSKVVDEILKILSPTLNYATGTIAQIPIQPISKHDDQILTLVKECIAIARNDWDSFENSWDFVRHPLLCGTNTIADSFEQRQQFTEDQFNHLKANEEELNRIFIDIYGLQNELTPKVEDKDITIRKADKGRDIRSLISYSVGCMFGRYSLDVDGLTYAGGQWDDSKYSTFIPDKDNILPITDEEYFEDDIVGLFVALVKKVFGTDTLEQNLDFIAKALGNKGNSSRDIIRNYFLKDFFKDHCKIYQKRPIYWLFDSGKADGFKALIYLHRYDENTIGNLRIDYLHSMQRVYESEIARMQDTIDNSTNAREVTTAEKRKEKLIKQLKETKEYDEKIAHLALARIFIDLDDGVKVNYEKVQTDADGKKLEVLAKI